MAILGHKHARQSCTSLVNQGYVLKIMSEFSSNPMDPFLTNNSKEEKALFIWMKYVILMWILCVSTKKNR